MITISHLDKILKKIEGKLVTIVQSPSTIGTKEIRAIHGHYQTAETALDNILTTLNETNSVFNRARELVYNTNVEYKIKLFSVGDTFFDGALEIFGDELRPMYEEVKQYINGNPPLPHIYQQLDDVEDDMLIEYNAFSCVSCELFGSDIFITVRLSATDVGAAMKVYIDKYGESVMTPNARLCSYGSKHFSIYEIIVFVS